MAPRILNLFTVLAVSMLSVSACVIREECIYFPKEGHPWRATIAATAVKDGSPTIIMSSATDCYSDEDHAILKADDPDNATNQALRNDLKVKAQLDCAAKVDEGGYTNAKCDPFADDFDGIIQIFEVQGQKCEQAVENGMEGGPEQEGRRLSRLARRERRRDLVDR